MASSIKDSKSVLVTGATSGIGKALALAISQLASKPEVIAVGRRKERLAELQQSGLQAVSLDLAMEHTKLKDELETIITKYPEIDSVVLCAGIQHEIDLSKPETIKFENILEEININYTSIVATITYLLPHFQKLAASGRPCNIIVISSGLCMIPAAWVPNYSATKAALHSFTMALRASLHGTTIRVVEVYPPLVESELHDAYGTTEKLSKTWMSLEEFVKLTMPPLINGDVDIPIGMSVGVFQKYEAGKTEFATQLSVGHKAGKMY
ncbi:hypothetical protein HYPSUDRAFT_33348 [Hypholoma sublateritium FD-334 SS-4]|uniref:NAD(P)-binding protein n=1 Tax=Hypholoma sublateritium (strain FD-334 SS-4) TaxID=945553 RepID=A0A0D2QB53_HYPSF|nr:hypothetical protein HYPSUDRAFT_33348 [Hypholoma sublateritium FD-334 SS-4]